MNKLAKESNLRCFERPLLSNDQKIEIGAMLNELIAEKRVAEIKYWKDGFIRQKIATPYRIGVRKELIVLDEYGMKWAIPINNICLIE